MKLFKRKILVAVSGGSDSMFLLDKLKNSFFYKPIAIHVNYHFRINSNKDEEAVRNYCKKHKIDFYVKNVTEDEKQNLLKINSNIEKTFREIRYNFFYEISKKEKTSYLFVGHHKDDFLETAMMQHAKSTNLLFYGINKKTYHHHLFIKRPLLKKWKNSILKKCSKRKIFFTIDETNFDPNFERNRIRINLSKLPISEKENMYKYFKKINKSNEKEVKDISKKYEIWKKDSFSLSFFKTQQSKMQSHLIYDFFKNSNFEINITSGKIENIIKFILSENNKEYVLMNDLILLIKNDRIMIIQK